MSNLSVLGYGEIRRTEDDRFSVFDTIAVIGGKKNPYETWKRLSVEFPEVLSWCEDFQFLGIGQRPTPVANKEKVEAILNLLQDLQRKRLVRKPVKESRYRDILALSLNGKTEIPTLAGSIDVLTPTEIIEVKSVKLWKAALGQILVYSFYYPSHQPRIHLYGETQASYLALVECHCNRFNVVMTWEA